MREYIEQVQPPACVTSSAIIHTAIGPPRVRHVEPWQDMAGEMPSPKGTIIPSALFDLNNAPLTRECDHPTNS